MRFTNFALAAFSVGSALAAPAVHQPHARALEILGVATTTVSTVKMTVDIAYQDSCTRLRAGPSAPAAGANV